MKRLSLSPQKRWSKKPIPSSTPGALYKILQRAAVKLFEAFDMGVTEKGSFEPARMQWTSPVAILPFTGTQLAGSLILTGPFELMSETTPSGQQDEADLIDWSRELANLLVGSLKTALLRHSVVIELGIPTSVLGADVRVAVPGNKAMGIVFARGDHLLHIALDAYFAEHVVFNLEDERETTFDVLLF